MECRDFLVSIFLSHHTLYSSIGGFITEEEKKRKCIHGISNKPLNSHTSKPTFSEIKKPT